jgi:hypothetical protein
MHGACDSFGDLALERGPQRCEVQVAVDAAELLAGLEHAGGAPAQRHLPGVPGVRPHGAGRRPVDLPALLVGSRRTRVIGPAGRPRLRRCGAPPTAGPTTPSPTECSSWSAGRRRSSPRWSLRGDGTASMSARRGARAFAGSGRPDARLRSQDGGGSRVAGRVVSGLIRPASSRAGSGADQQLRTLCIQSSSCGHSSRCAPRPTRTPTCCSATPTSPR